MLLCDHAVVAEGKLYISGGGWSQTGPDPSPTAIAMKIDVPWDRTNTPIALRLRLVGADGEPVTQAGPMGPVPIEVGAQLEVGRPPGLAQGTPIDAPMAINLPPFLLPPGQRFSWDLEIDGETNENWHLAFSTRPARQSPSSPTNLPPAPSA